MSILGVEEHHIYGLPRRRSPTTSRPGSWAGRLLDVVRPTPS